MDDDLKNYLADQSPEERERLELTLNALRSVPDQEIPRRISFVSDKVFEPKWWQRIPVWGMASAAMLSLSVMAHGYLSRPAVIYQAAETPAPVVRQVARESQSVDTAALEALYQQKLDAALKKAAADYDHKLEFERRAILMAVEDNFNLMRKQMSRMYMASANVDTESAQ